MVTTVTGKNQVTIPADVAREAHIVQGSQLDWTFDSKKRVLQVKILPSRGEVARGLWGAGRKYGKSGDDWGRDLGEERVRDDAKRGQNLEGKS